MTKALISASALVLALSFAGPAVAQLNTELSIGGVPVPSDQLDAVQAKCDELFAANQATAVAQPDATTPAADAPAAGASDDVAATESAAEPPVEDSTAMAEADPAAGNMAADTDAAAAAAGADAQIDIAAITVELCEEGGFTDSAVPAD